MTYIAIGAALGLIIAVVVVAVYAALGAARMDEDRNQK